MSTTTKAFIDNLQKQIVDLIAQYTTLPKESAIDDKRADLSDRIFSQYKQLEIHTKHSFQFTKPVVSIDNQLDTLLCNYLYNDRRLIIEFDKKVFDVLYVVMSHNLDKAIVGMSVNLYSKLLLTDITVSTEIEINLTARTYGFTNTTENKGSDIASIEKAFKAVLAKPLCDNHNYVADRFNRSINDLANKLLVAPNHAAFFNNTRW